MRADLDLVERLLKIAEAIVANRTTQISDSAIRILRDQVREQRMNLREEPNIVGYEATFLVECIAEIAFARSDRREDSEQRAKMHINTVRAFMQGDLVKASREFVGGHH
jgi:hypothetical protein